MASSKPTFAKIAAKAVSMPVRPVVPRIHPAVTMESEAVAKTPTDESSTHISSAASSIKPGFDKQSSASGTTYTLDEKESLRPDDSASIRAVEDDREDGTGTSLVGSEAGDVRAFSDQLLRIQQIGTPRTILRPNITFGQLNLNSPSDTPSPAVAEEADKPNPISVAPDMPPVDEKLLEGLSSPRDRVFILKIEQDILDFMKTEKEIHLTLPDCNSFYRMLAHRLADYYGLDHTHHPRDSGTAVLISKTPDSRIPPPLAALPVPGVQCNSPPPAPTTRKIMRRGHDGKGASGPSTTANSEGPSKAASEAGDGASEIGRPKDKSTMTREERERQYAEARLRILGAAEPEADESKKAAVDTEMSRSSSTSGKKRNKKRKDDDDFEPRSQFPGYYNAPYAPATYGDGTFYFPAYSGMNGAPQSQQMPSSTSPQPMTYQYGAYTQADASMPSHYMAPQPQYGGQAGNTAGMPAYGQGMNGQYDLSSAFQAMNFGSSQAMPLKQNSSPGFTMPGQMPGQQQTWGSTFTSGSYGFPTQDSYMPNMPNMPDRSMSSPGISANTTPYAYGQLPNVPTQNNQMQHPLPGSYNRPQFNPQTQAFIPGGQAPHMQVHVQQNGHQVFSPFVAPSNASQVYRHTPPAPAAPHRSPLPKNPALAGSPFSPVTQPNRPLSHPLPQPPNPESSIAKWGTPAHLPPKPPAPADPHPHKFVDINRNLPSARGQGMPRTLSGV